MDSRVTNPRILRRSNKINIMFKLLTEGDKSRLQLAAELGLTTASITQISRELIEEGFIEERGSMQRNSTGRPEILLHFCENACGAVGVNIERDKTHISLCTYNRVIEEKIFLTSEIVQKGKLTRLAEEIRRTMNNRPEELKLLGIGIGITGKVDEAGGIAVDSHGILPADFPLAAELQEQLGCSVSVINNVKAQARALIRSRDDNFMLVKHSPGIGCAVIVQGKAVEGFHYLAGELGHTVVALNGQACECGKRGCLETVASERAIERAYYEKSGERKDIATIYSEYGQVGTADGIINNLVERLALAIGNAATITDPALVMVTGGLFFIDEISEQFMRKFEELGYSKLYRIKRIGNEKKIKAFAGARHIILNKLFEV